MAVGEMSAAAEEAEGNQHEQIYYNDFHLYLI